MMMDRSPGWILAVTLWSCVAHAEAQDTKPASKPVARVHETHVMGTSLRIEVEGLDPAKLDKAIDAAVAEMRRVEDLMTDWRASPLTTLNEAAGDGPVEVPLELAAIVSRGIEVSKRTGGAFDPTYAAVGELWDFKAKAPVVPSQASVKQALTRVGAQRVSVDPERSSVTLPAGMKLGLGGIAKGYGVDCAMRVLREHGVRHGCVNAGGDLKVLGRSGGRPWEIAIKHPRRREHAIAALRVSNTCVVTSGDYERFFEIEGRRYHHIIDPRDGYPSRGCISATVVGPSAELADALATAVCVLGLDEGLALIDDMPSYDVIAVGVDESIRATGKLAASLR